VSGLGAGLLGQGRGPVLALPVDQVRGGRVGHAFPPHIAVVGQRHVREDHIALQAGHAVEVGLVVGARRNAEIASLRIDRIEATIRTRLDPGDVITDRGHLPAVQASRRDQHGEVGLATSAGESGGDVVLLAFGRGHAQHQHVLGQPALLTAHGRGDAQRKALLAQQRIATVP
jgi:hypothetical protein